MESFRRVLVVVVLCWPMTGCSLKTYAINMVGDALTTGDSVYETDDDLELVGAALPFGLKLTESLLAQSPRHRGLLLTATKGFVLYSYGYVGYAAQVAADTDLDRARAMRGRARRLYLRAFDYGIRGLEESYRGFGDELSADARTAVRRIGASKRERDLPMLYWTAAALGLAISVSPDDASLLARLPDVDAMLDRALELDEAWDQGALHEFKVVLSGARPGAPDQALIRRHYERAVALSGGANAGVHVAYAEAVSIPNQDIDEFRALLKRALAVDPDEHPADRLANVLAHRRAQWLADREDELILTDDPIDSSERTP